MVAIKEIFNALDTVKSKILTLLPIQWVSAGQKPFNGTLLRLNILGH